MRLTLDIARGAWIAGRLDPFGASVAAWVPSGYAAIARVLHPPTISGRDAEGAWSHRETTWREVAALRGRVFHPAVHWTALADSDHQVALNATRLLNPPDQGRLNLDRLAALASVLVAHGETAATAGIWHGWGDLSPVESGRTLLSILTGRPAPPPPPFDVDPAVPRAARHGPTLSLPHREYVLFEVDVREFLDPSWPDSARIGAFGGSAQTPNLLWPDDRSWFLATEIDFDSTLVAGSRALVDALLAHPALEVVEGAYDTDLSRRGDTINA